MCSVATRGPCPCSTRASSTGVGTVALAVGSTLLVIAWWLTGPRIIGRNSRRPRRYARRVHAAGRVALVALVACAALWPWPTLVALAALAPAGTAAAIVGRRRRVARTRAELAATPRPPLRVAVDTGWTARRHGEHLSGPRAQTWGDAARTPAGDRTPRRRHPR